MKKGCYKISPKKKFYLLWKEKIILSKIEMLIKSIKNYITRNDI